MFALVKDFAESLALILNATQKLFMETSDERPTVQGWSKKF